MSEYSDIFNMRMVCSEFSLHAGVFIGLFIRCIMCWSAGP